MVLCIFAEFERALPQAVVLVCAEQTLGQDERNRATAFEIQVGGAHEKERREFQMRNQFAAPREQAIVLRDLLLEKFLVRGLFDEMVRDPRRIADDEVEFAFEKERLVNVLEHKRPNCVAVGVNEILERIGNRKERVDERIVVGVRKMLCLQIVAEQFGHDTLALVLLGVFFREFNRLVVLAQIFQ